MATVVIRVVIQVVRDAVVVVVVVEPVGDPVAIRIHVPVDARGRHQPRRDVTSGTAGDARGRCEQSSAGRGWKEDFVKTTKLIRLKFQVCSNE